MKRIDFIKGLIALGGLSFLSGKFVEAKQFRKFYLLQSFVRGFKFYEGPLLLDVMKEGDLLELVREPDNEYDPCAIALHWNQKKIGFVPAEDNDMLSKLLDIGVPELIAEIVHLKPEAATWENVHIAIYVLKEIPANEQIPSSAAYLTELETPYYRTLKRADETITRIKLPGYVAEDHDLADGNLEMPDAYRWLMERAKTDNLKHMVETSVDPSGKYGEAIDFMVAHIDQVPVSLRDQLLSIQSEIYNAEQMFDDRGYIVLALDKVEHVMDRISGIGQITDKLGRNFLAASFS